jgi:hypothetical protein
VKNEETALAFDIPPQIAKMLIEYRDRIAPKVIGRTPVCTENLIRVDEVRESPRLKR